MKYLYGAAIQGIQSFIFETNKLREITGASELIETVCTSFFEQRLREIGEYSEQNVLINAAGNIKYIFDNKATCEKFVYDFPRQVMQMASGITISQAVIKLTEGLEKDSIQKLEDRLKIQRNKAVSQHGTGWMISERARKTGKPGQYRDGDDVIDLSQYQKRQVVKQRRNSLLKKILPETHHAWLGKLPYEMEDIIESRERGWVAVIHADGNNLGKKIIKLSSELDEKHIKNAFRELSTRLERATVSAASSAFSSTFSDDKLAKRKKLPIRPVVLGGDDLTVIIDGQFAIQFTYHFLKHFEENTKREFSNFQEKFNTEILSEGLTACAGIAFVKHSYPFHYAVELSESLCKHTKKIAKGLKGSPSSLMFHKVHSSFVEDYTEIINRELSAGSIQFDYGPYFVEEQNSYATIDQLLEWVEVIKEKNAPAAPIRNWLSELKINEDRAEQQMKRIIKLNDKYKNKLNFNQAAVKRNGKSYTHLFDVLSLANIQK